MILVRGRTPIKWIFKVFIRVDPRQSVSHFDFTNRIQVRGRLDRRRLSAGGEPFGETRHYFEMRPGVVFAFVNDGYYNKDTPYIPYDRLAG